MSNQKFKVGDKVCKTSGYHYFGVVKASYEVSPNQWRYDVMFDTIGMLHIFGDQLMSLSDEDYQACSLHMKQMCTILNLVREGNKVDVHA